MATTRTRISIERIDLPGGRKASVSAYDDGSVRFELADGPYVIQEAFLGGKDSSVVMLSPGGQGSAAARGKVQAPAAPDS
ncbi:MULTISPECIES: hypothetical protein [Streptacidiphilus]|uniref:Uncharacterized protein n=1 Tax=Streptacidiphilus cavernicola TaxID=3342716 RepID=A0ABV6UYC7_9ACTN|nr:hypothetical protein [Streptacidiphilus jeojiense]